MSEKPPWLKVVGGKKHVPDTRPPQPEVVKVVSDSELHSVYRSIRNNLPADYRTKATAEQVEREATGMLARSRGQLYEILSQPDIWTHPARTIAAINEVHARLRIGNLDARK